MLTEMVLIGLKSSLFSTFLFNGNKHLYSDPWYLGPHWCVCSGFYSPCIPVESSHKIWPLSEVTDRKNMQLSSVFCLWQEKKRKCKVTLLSKWGTQGLTSGRTWKSGIVHIILTFIFRNLEGRSCVYPQLVTEVHKTAPSHLPSQLLPSQPPLW